MRKATKWGENDFSLNLAKFSSERRQRPMQQSVKNNNNKINKVQV